jgi:hypothetical protein
VSGGLPLEQRPSLLAAVDGVERGDSAGIIVGYLSRLGRNVREQLRTYDRVHAAGGRIIVAQEGIDARTRGGRLQRNILAAIHEDEREAHVDRLPPRSRYAEASARRAGRRRAVCVRRSSGGDSAAGGDRRSARDVELRCALPAAQSGLSRRAAGRRIHEASRPSTAGRPHNIRGRPAQRCPSATGPGRNQRCSRDSSGARRAGTG